MRFQGLFHSPSRGAFHLSLTVLVHYRSLKVFSLGGWSPQLPTGFHVSRGTQDPGPQPPAFALRDSHPLWSRFPDALRASSSIRTVDAAVLQPQPVPSRTPTGLGCVPVRSPLLRESRLISFLGVLRCFSSPTAPRHRLCVQQAVSRHHSGGVAPFGILRVHRLHAAPPKRFAGLRVLLRLFSAKASTSYSV